MGHKSTLKHKVTGKFSLLQGFGEKFWGNGGIAVARGGYVFGKIEFVYTTSDFRKKDMDRPVVLAGQVWRVAAAYCCRSYRTR
jgi:hypothetical protein